MSYEARNDNYIRDVSQEVDEAVAFCAMQCHCGGGSQYNVTLRCFDGFHKNEDRNIEYKPTAEWQRIQTELQQGREAVEKLKRIEEGYEVMKERLLDSGELLQYYDGIRWNDTGKLFEAREPLPVSNFMGKQTKGESI